MVQVLALELNHLLRVLDLIPTYGTYLLRLIMLDRFQIVSLADGAEVLPALPHYLIEWLLILRLLVEDTSILREPLLSSLFANILCRCVARWLLVN